MGKIELYYNSGLIGDEKGLIWNLWGRDVCMQNLYTYIYIYVRTYICIYIYVLSDLEVPFLLNIRKC